MFNNEFVKNLVEELSLSWMVGNVVMLMFVMTVLIPGTVVYGDPFAEIIGGVALALLGLTWLVTCVSVSIPHYLNSVSGGQIDIRGRYRYEALGHTTNLAGIVSFYGLVFLSTVWLLSTIAVILSVVPFVVTLIFAGIVVTVIGLHFVLKLVFRVSNAFKRHEGDPDAHKS